MKKKTVYISTINHTNKGLKVSVKPEYKDGDTDEIAMNMALEIMKTYTTAQVNVKKDILTTTDFETVYGKSSQTQEKWRKHYSMPFIQLGDNEAIMYERVSIEKWFKSQVFNDIEE